MAMNIKNVVIVCDYAYIEGGAARVAVQTATALARYTDLNIYFFAGCGEPCSELRDSRVKVITLMMYDLLGNPNRIDAMKNGIYNKKAGKRMAELLSRLDGKETIVHVHTWTKVLSSAVFKAAQNAGIPVFLTVHDYFLTCPNGGCFNYVQNKICELLPLSAKCVTCNCDARHYYHKIWRCIRQRKQNKVIRGCNNIRYIFISDFEKQQVLRRMPAPEHQFMVKNPIAYQERYRVHAENNELFLFIGRVSEEKGVELFCKAVCEAGVKAVVIGDGKSKDKLKKQYPEITFTGWIEKSEIQQWIDRGRCLIFPSLWYEGAPLTVLEVQAYGLPCIVTNSSSAMDSVEQGITGEIIDPNVEDMTSAINKMKDDNYIERLSGETYLRFDENRCSEQYYVEQLLETYNQGV